MKTRMSLMKKGTAFCAVAVSSLLLGSGMSVQAATSTEAASWGAELKGDVTVGQSGGDVTVTFDGVGGSFPVRAEALLVAESGSAESGFAGNYAAAGVNSLSFNVAVSGASINPGSHVVLLSGAGTWYTYGGGIAAAGAKSISFDRDAGAWQPESGSNTDESWAQALANVVGVGIRVGRGGNAAQGYTVSGFAISSDQAIGSSALSALEQALLARFGVTSAASVGSEDASADSDGDGMTDLNEILAENDPDYFATKLFLADIISATADAVTIQWACVAGFDYSILRASSLDGSFDVIAGPSAATATGFQTYTDEDAGDGAFYLIQQQD